MIYEMFISTKTWHWNQQWVTITNQLLIGQSVSSKGEISNKYESERHMTHCHCRLAPTAQHRQNDLFLIAQNDAEWCWLNASGQTISRTDSFFDQMTLWITTYFFINTTLGLHAQLEYLPARLSAKPPK